MIVNQTSSLVKRNRRELVKRKTKLAQNELSERDVNPTDELQVDDDTSKNDEIQGLRYHLHLEF